MVVQVVALLPCGVAASGLILNLGLYLCGVLHARLEILLRFLAVIQ